VSSESISTAVNSSGAQRIQFTGLASGLNTSSIITALLSAERQPITHLSNQQEKLVAQRTAIATIKTSLLELNFAGSEFRLPSLFEGTQTVTSSEPSRITATATASGAAVGGYELEVTQLANSAQRSFTFASPAAEETITVDGREYTLKAGATAKELAAKINADGKGTVYAALQGTEGIVLSSRTTGATGGEFIAVAGAALTERAGTAKAGRDAEYSLDGVAGKSSSNTVTEAIAGVSLTFGALTGAGPVTIAVQPPAPSVKAIEAQLQSFVALYNSTVEAIQTQLSTKPPANPQNAAELATGTLYGDSELNSLLGRVRQTMYTALGGLPAEMSSPLDLGVSTGAPTGGNSSKSSLAGTLKLDPAKLAKAIAGDPEGAKLMMQKWAQSFTTTVNAAAAPGGSLETRINGDEGQVRAMKQRIATMNEMLAVRQRSLEQTYARLESVISHNTAQSSWLTSQSAQLEKSGL
jgi:flagellar hook-associated protein 2